MKTTKMERVAVKGIGTMLVFSPLAADLRDRAALRLARGRMVRGVKYG